MSSPPVEITAPTPAVALPGAEPRAAGSARGIAFMVLAVGLFAIMDAVIKWLGDSYPTMQLIFFRSLFAFIPLGFLVFHGGLREALATRHPLGHLLRALLGITAMVCYFYAFAHMPLADVIAITFAAPIFVVALSVPLLGEKVGARRWSAVLLGFAGVLVMLQPGVGGIDPLVVVPLAGTVFYAFAAILVRRLSRTESSAAIVFYFTLASTLLSAAFMPFQWVTPGLADLALLIAIGLIGGLAQISMTSAFRSADVAVIMPFEYTAMIWAVLLGFFIWGEVPGTHIWLGVTLVMLSGLYILYRESTLGLPRGIARRLHMRR